MANTAQFNWDDARIFLALARTGTLTQAAQQLGLGIATLSRRIERLEEAINTPLFIRSQTGYQLTEDGVVLVASAEQMEAAVHSFSDQAHQQQEVSGIVRLATAENFATAVILPNIFQFKQRYPKLALDIITDVRTANLHRHDADLALRMVKPTQGNVTFRRIGILGYGLYRSPTVETALSANNAIGWSSHYQDLPAAKWLTKQLDQATPTLTTTSLTSQIAACQAGLGFAVLPHFLTQNTQLICVEELPDIAQDIYLVMHTDLSHSKRVRAVAEFLVELVEQDRQKLEFA